VSPSHLSEDFRPAINSALKEPTIKDIMLWAEEDTVHQLKQRVQDFETTNAQRESRWPSVRTLRTFLFGYLEGVKEGEIDCRRCERD